ncbi:hypothetical protein, variant 1 [Phytophthora nicotianae CJ01A1]|uniref:Phospholipid/glycerol acyltransferase domain-containing protein n=3 Tax=Phytophthora nicotianae TaxID=4792 RepID=W2IUY3_PHYNI|nr:hypothetical protein, variant 1 [Phytophthora nicotianae]ETL37960.1 hypothetical protein, variant 1 [Phytophthora nicotianae]ETL91071.1 hypothetical protein, variant 1 [Phytophthora nicotianae]ETO59089.1 hypothetical protein, variant 1 [Phytophthora nicotianae P1976]ETP14359.1 hypothetical protein, variant 1 [Phytophthora nicotianae CJ01A1]
MSRSAECQAQASVNPAKRCDAGPVAEPEAESVLGRAVHPSTKFETPWTWSGCIIGCSYLLLLVVTAFLNATFVLWPLTLLCWTRILSIRSCRSVFRFLEDKYFAMLSGYLEFVGGVKIVMTGDEELQFDPQEHVLLICNHRSEVDWIFFWNLALRLNVHDRIRVMMKSIIRYAPGVGWTMMLLQYPYINRNWATDQDRLTKVIQSYKYVDMGTWLAMFPEGTALYDKTLKKSHKFAEKQGEARWNYVLQPRVKGFELCMDKMDPDYVVDLTVAYPELMEGVRPSPVRFVRGQFPTEVHMHVQRYHRSTLTKHKDHMGQWIGLLRRRSVFDVSTRLARLKASSACVRICHYGTRWCQAQHSIWGSAALRFIGLSTFLLLRAHRSRLALRYR